MWVYLMAMVPSHAHHGGVLDPSKQDVQYLLAMRARTVLTQHIWAGKYTVTQSTKLEADAVRREVVKAVDESGERVQRRCHVYRQDLVLRLRVLYHKLQDANTLQKILINMAVAKKCVRTRT